MNIQNNWPMLADKTAPRFDIEKIKTMDDESKRKLLKELPKLMRGIRDGK